MESKWPGSEGNGGGKFCCFDINLLLGHSDYYKGKLTVQSPIHHCSSEAARDIHACLYGFLDMNAFLGNFVILGKEAHRMQKSDQHE